MKAAPHTPRSHQNAVARGLETTGPPTIQAGKLPSADHSRASPVIMSTKRSDTGRAMVTKATSIPGRKLSRIKPMPLHRFWLIKTINTP
jgi:hypothetical protein